MNPIILIPARMASTRLPDKPMALIDGEPMIVQVWRRAVEANVGRVVVACDSAKIADAVRTAGGEAVLTDPNLPSGSDRIHAALQGVDPQKKHDVVINVQGDMPTLDPDIIRQLTELMKNSSIDIGTVAAPFQDDSERTNQAAVKALVALQPNETIGRAVDFNRENAPKNDTGPNGERILHHGGLYGYKRSVLEEFVAQPPSKNELSRKLEQMRAMDNGKSIYVLVVPEVPLGVDTPETLEIARKEIRKI
jgi:3-deoxy-manno-octulosonate cytidylyltransferase (CMP-KDO synthetase)